MIISVACFARAAGVPVCICGPLCKEQFNLLVYLPLPQTMAHGYWGRSFISVACFTYAAGVPVCICGPLCREQFNLLVYLPLPYAMAHGYWGRSFPLPVSLTLPGCPSVSAGRCAESNSTFHQTGGCDRCIGQNHRLHNRCATHHQHRVVGTFRCIACPCVVSTAPMLLVWRRLPAGAGASHHSSPRLLPIRVPSHTPSDARVVSPVANDATTCYHHHQRQPCSRAWLGARLAWQRGCCTPNLRHVYFRA